MSSETQFDSLVERINRGTSDTDVSVPLDHGTVVHADAVDAMRSMDDNSVKTVLTDVPYDEVTRDDSGLRNLDKGVADVLSFDLQTAVEEMKRIASDSIYVFCGFNQVSFIRQYLDDECSTRILVWNKTNPSPLNCQYLWLSDVELCVYGKHSSGEFNGNYESAVIEHKSGSSDRHPTEKPVGLFETLVEMSSSEGDVVFDPFVGSGTTLEAADNLDRIGVGVEKEFEYVDMAEARV